MRAADGLPRMQTASWLAYRVYMSAIAAQTGTRARGTAAIVPERAPNSGGKDTLRMDSTPARQRNPLPLPRLSTTTLALLALAGAATLWGTSFVAAKVVLAEVPPVTLACLRFLIAAVVLLPLSLRRRRPVFSRDAALLGLTGISVFFLLQYAGLRLASAADATLVLGGALPLLTTLLGLAVLAEKLDRWQLGGLICSLLGVAVVALNSANGRGSSSGWGIGLLFLAAACGAISFVVGRRVFSGPDLIPTLAGSTIYGVIFLLPVAAIELHSVGLVMPSPRALVFLLYLGAGCSALAFALWAFGLRHLTAAQNALVSNLELPIGLLAALLLGEALGWGQLAGGPLIVAGALLAAATPRREEREPARIAQLDPSPERIAA